MGINIRKTNQFIYRMAIGIMLILTLTLLEHVNVMAEESEAETSVAEADEIVSDDANGVLILGADAGDISESESIEQSIAESIEAEIMSEYMSAMAAEAESVSREQLAKDEAESRSIEACTLEIESTVAKLQKDEKQRLQTMLSCLVIVLVILSVGVIVYLNKTRSAKKATDYARKIMKKSSVKPVLRDDQKID